MFRDLKSTTGLMARRCSSKQLEPVLAEHQRLQGLIHDRQVGTQGFDLLGIAVLPEPAEGIIENDARFVGRFQGRVPQIGRWR